MKVLISAAEASSDKHGAELLISLKKRFPQLEAFGVGGDHLRSSGLDVLCDASGMRAMGSSEAISRLPTLLRALNTLSEAARQRQPDFAILLDYPEFHFKLAKRLKKQGIPVVYYIPPKLWVWRKHRIRFFQRNVDFVLCLLPFEVGFFQRARVRAAYAGNPLIDELPLDLPPEDARSSLNLTGERVSVAVMPGSRPSELKYHFELFLDSVLLAAKKKNTSFQVRIPLASQEDADHAALLLEKWKANHSADLDRLQIQLSVGNSATVLRACDIGIIKSGTSTLEAGLMGLPHIVAYTTSPLTHRLFRWLVRFEGPIGLVNIALNWMPGQKVNRRQCVFEEFAMEEAEPEGLSTGLIALLEDSDRKARIQQAVDQLRSRLGKDESGHPIQPSQTAAKEIEQWFEESKKTNLKQTPRVKWRLSFWIASFVLCRWNQGVRFVREMLGIRGQKLSSSARVVSVGNIQIGGAGKTPIVAELARQAHERGLTVCILTRGYQGAWEKMGGILSPQDSSVQSSQCGDEPALLRELAPHAWIGVGRDRIASFQKVSEKTQIDLVLLDDGFQHWKIDRDVDLVALTSAQPGQQIFREGFAALKKTDCVFWTKGDVLPCVPASVWDRVFSAEFQIPKCSDSHADLAFCLITAVAQPDSVEQSLDRAGYSIRKRIDFADHHAYTQKEIHSLLELVKQENLEVILSGKDWVKWKEVLRLPPQSLVRDQLTEVDLPEGGRLYVFEPILRLNAGSSQWEAIVWGK